MGSNKTFQSRTDHKRVMGDSPEFRKLRRAIEKADGDRERALKNVCRLYAVRNIDALPPGVLAAAVALITGS